MPPGRLEGNCGLWLDCRALRRGGQLPFRGIHVMVEKPLRVQPGRRPAKIQALAKTARHSCSTTNYETTWYPSGYTAYELVHNEAAIGPIGRSLFVLGISAQGT